MKERENREFWIRQTTVLLAMPINRYLYTSLYCHHRVASGGAEPGPAWTKTIQGSSLPFPRPHRTGYLKLDLIRARVFVKQKLLPGATPLDPLRNGKRNHGKATVRRRRAADAHGWRAGHGGRGGGIAGAIPSGAPLHGSLPAPEMRELNRIGVNLNQMARAMNSGAAAPAETREAVEQVNELVARLLAGEAE